MSGPVAIIAAVAENGVIGRGNGLPWRLPSDLKRFKALTLGHTLVMGRRTFASIGRPLPGRRTIVVTSGTLFGVDVAPSVGAALALADAAVFLAGGAAIYRDGFEHADTLHITRVHARPDGDTLFPPIDTGVFRLADREPGQPAPGDDHAVTYETYVRQRAD